MQEQDIITFLSLVGEELQEIGIQQPIRLLLIGGAYMLTQIHNRATTKDVDVIVLEPLEPEDYRIFKQAIDFVAHDQKMSRAWLSDNIAQFLQSTGKLPAGTLWLAHGKLEVYIPDAGYILATKIMAGREKDLADIEALFHRLKITTRKQAEKLLKKYVIQKTLKNYTQDIQITLDHFFP